MDNITRIRLAKRFLVVAVVAALIIIASCLTAVAQCPTCPGGVCPRPVVVAAEPVFRAPIRESIYKFLTPQGAIVYGYYRGPVQPVTREQALRNAAYWQEQAAKLPQ